MSKQDGYFGRGVRLGRIAGVDVSIHWTWGIAASLIALLLARSVFPDEVAGLSRSTYWTMGVATALLFFVTLLLHELGHALQARREGIPTRGITLWMLGGVAQSGAPFETPGTEARVALAGPAVSLVLGGGLVVVGRLAGIPDAIAAVLEWLGWTNLLILAFNMLPALPLDGGRVLRAALWRFRRDQLRATRDAARVSQVLSGIMIALGVVAWFSGGLGGLWLAFVGLFVWSSGAAERAAAEARAALAGLHVADVMTPDPITIAAGASAEDLLALARRTGHSVYPVVGDRGETIGLVSALSVERLPERRRAWVTVAELLADSPGPLVVDAETEVISTVPALASYPLHRAAVSRAGRLVGLISLSDITRAARWRTRLGAV